MSESQHERGLKKLAWAIEASIGQFKLFLARCNCASLRSRLVEQLQGMMSAEIHTIELKGHGKTLHATTQAQLGSECPSALMVFGLESVSNLDEVLSATDPVREELRDSLPFPVVLWVTDEVLDKLIELAPGLDSWSIVRDFPSTLRQAQDSASLRVAP